MKIILEWPPELELNIEVIMSRYNFTSKQEAIEFAVKELAANSANTARRVMLNQLVGLGKKYER